MADIKITDLAAYTDPVSTDVLPIVDVGSDLTKKVSIADLLENAGTGNVTAPSFSFDGDNDTGIYQPGLDQIAISTGGIQRLQVDSSGNMLLGGTLPSTSNITLNANGSATFAGNVALDSASPVGISIESPNPSLTLTDNVGDVFLTTDTNGALVLGTGTAKAVRLQTNGTDSLRIEETGNVLIGGTLPSAPNITLNENGSAQFATSVQVVGNGAAGAEVGLVLGAGSVNATRTLGSNSNVFRGYYTGNSTPTSRISSDGTAQFAGGDITLNADGSAEFAGDVKSLGFLTSSDTAANDRVQFGYMATPAGHNLGHRIVGDGTDLYYFSRENGTTSHKFYVYNSGGSYNLMEVNGAPSDEKVMIGGTLPSAPNISLNADGSAQFSGSVSIGGTAAANTIDEYEEGTWTPTMTEFGGSSIPFTITNAAYVRVGEVVTIQALLVLTAASNGQVLNPVIAGLPYTQKGRSNCQITTTNSTVNSQGYSSSGPVFVARSNSSIQCGPTDAEQLVITSTYIIA